MNTRTRGFSLVELMVVLLIFMVVSSVIFGLINVAQIRYRSEQQLLDSFSSARSAVDLMVRDVRNAGYPPPYTYAGNLAYAPTGATPVTFPAPVPWTDPALAGATLQNRYSAGIIGFNGGLVRDMTCTVNGGANPCRIPNPWDMILETDADPENTPPGNVPTVELVRYNLCWADPNGLCIPVTQSLVAPANTPPWLVRSVATKNMVANPTGALGAIPQLTSNVALVEVIIQNPAAAPNALLPDGSRNTPMFQYICPGGVATCTVELVRYNLCWADPNGPCIPVTQAFGAPANTPPWLVRSVATKNMVANPTGALGAIPQLTSNVALVEVIIQNPAAAPNALLPDGSRNTPMFQYICPGGVATCTVEQVDSVIVTVRTRSANQDVQTRRFRAVTVQGMARRLNPSR